jgi:hypothetical protein
MPKREDALAEAALAAQLENAVDATSQEIFASAFGDEDPVLDETGDRAIENMGEGLEGQTEVDDEDAETEEGEGEESETEGEAGKDDKGEDAAEKAEAEKLAAEKVEAEKLAAEKPPEGKVPPGRLREQTERTKAAETERDALKAQVETERANSRKEIDELKAQFNGVLAALQRQQPAAPKVDETKPAAPPDVFEDPKGFAEYLTKGFQSELAQRDQRMESLRVDMSMQTAAGRHGDNFAKAYDAVSKLDPRNPDDQVTVRRIWASPNPGEALVTWHRNQETLREVGNDPGKFKERIAKETRESLVKDPEFRKQLIAELRAEAGDDGTGRPKNSIVKLPRSLNRATGGTSREAIDPSTVDDSQQGIFESAWRD